MVPVDCISRSWGQKKGFKTATFKNCLACSHKTLSLYIWYNASFIFVFPPLTKYGTDGLGTDQCQCWSRCCMCAWCHWCPLTGTCAHTGWLGVSWYCCGYAHTAESQSHCSLPGQTENKMVDTNFLNDHTVVLKMFIFYFLNTSV